MYFYFHTLLSRAGASTNNDDDEEGLDTTSIVIIVIWQFILTAGLFTVCGCYLSRRYKSKNTVSDNEINFTDLEKINADRPKTAKLETAVNFVTSTTSTRANKETGESTVTVVRKSVQFPHLPKMSLPPIPSRRSFRKSREPGPYSITEDVDAGASAPALSAKQSFIGMVLESMDDFEV